MDRAVFGWEFLVIDWIGLNLDEEHDDIAIAQPYCLQCLCSHGRNNARGLSC